MENVRNRIKIELLKNDNQTKIRQQPKWTSNGSYKSYAKYNCYTFKQNIIHMDKPFRLGFVVLELNKLHLYESYYDKLEP